MTATKMAWENEPAYLDEEQRHDPFSAIREFCEQDTLFAHRTKLFEVFQAGLASRELDPDEAGAFMSLYGTLNKLMEAAYLVDKRNGQ